MRLANAYARINELRKGISIYQMILRCLDEGYMVGKSVMTFRIIVMRNYANALVTIDKFKEALELLQDIYHLSLNCNYGYIIPIVLDDMAWTEMQICKIENIQINVDEIKRKKRQAYYIAAARKDNKIKKIIKKSYEDMFNENIMLI